MKRAVLTVFFALAGSMAFGQLSSAAGPAIQMMPQPSTVAICLLALATLIVLNKKTT